MADEIIKEEEIAQASEAAAEEVAAETAEAPAEEEVIDIEQAVIKCFADVICKDPSTIKTNDRLDIDLHVNTDMCYTVALKLEEAIGIKFSVADIRRHRTVAKVIKMVKMYYNC